MIMRYCHPRDAPGVGSVHEDILVAGRRQLLVN